MDDRVTVERNEIGLIFGGAPVKLETIVGDLKSDKESTRRHLKKLEAGQYIRTRRTPYGQVIEVLNSKKFGIWGKEKPQSAVSLRVEKPTGESEKPQSAVSKEDHARTMQVKAAAEGAMPPMNLEPWTGIGLSRPVGNAAFRELWETTFCSRNGHTLSQVMGDCADAWQGRNGKVPGPFFARLSEIRKQERATGEAHQRSPESRMPTIRDIVPKER